MNLKRSLLLALLLVVLVVTPTFVGAQDESAVTIGWPQEPDNLNPLYTTMTYAGYTISLVYAPAWTYNADLEPFPVLAAELPSTENGGISEDGTTFTIKVKEGLTWSDGDPLDSADFVFTAEMYRSEQNTPLSRGAYEDMVEVSAPDAQTVVVRFDNPYSAWLGLFGAILPEHIFRPVLEEEGTLDNAVQNREPTVSSGPYLFEEWDTGNFLRFSANPDYTLGQPSVSTLLLRFFGDDETYVASLIADEIQIATFFDFSYVPSIEEAGIEVQVLPAGYNEGWFFNVGPDGHPALKDVNVRQALSLAFDREAITTDLLLGATYPGSSFWEGTPYENPELEAVPFDLEQAQQLLDDAGWVDSNGDGTRDQDGVEFVIRFVTNTRPIRAESIAPIVQQQFAEIGVGVELVTYPSDQYFGGYNEGGPIATGQYDIAQWSTAPGAFPDPNVRAFRCDEIPSPEVPSGSNWTYFCDEAITDLFIQQEQETDFDARVELFHQIDELVYNSYVWVSVWFDADTWAVAPRLSASVNGIAPFWDVQNWTITE